MQRWTPPYNHHHHLQPAHARQDRSTFLPLDHWSTFACHPAAPVWMASGPFAQLTCPASNASCARTSMINTGKGGHAGRSVVVVVVLVVVLVVEVPVAVAVVVVLVTVSHPHASLVGNGSSSHSR
jgi:hypothetical protein